MTPLSHRDLLALHAPITFEDARTLQSCSNPTHKPTLGELLVILAAARYRYADTMLATRMQPDENDWIHWSPDGDAVPTKVSFDTRVITRRRNGLEVSRLVGECRWSHTSPTDTDYQNDIVAYRVAPLEE